MLHSIPQILSYEMKTLDEFDRYLKERGYKESQVPYSYVDTVLCSVDYEKDEYFVVLYVSGTEKFWEELKENGTKDFSPSDYEVTAIFIQSPITNIADFCTNKREGIQLVNKVTSDSWIKHDFSLLEYCLGLQKIDLVSHEKKILGCHLKNLEYLEKYKKFLEDHDYKVYYSSIFDVSEECERDSSDLSLKFRHYSGKLISFETDCLTGVLKLDDKPIGTDQDLGKYLEENYWINKKTGKPNDEYNYFYDPEETKESYSETVEFLQLYQREIWGKEFNHLPKIYKKDYENYRNRIPRR